METGTPVGLCIAIYSQDCFGLGHIQPTCSITWEGNHLRAEASVLTFPTRNSASSLPFHPTMII